MEQVIDETCNNVKRYKLITTPPFKLAKLVDEKNQHRKPHTKPCCTKGQMKGITKQSQEKGMKHEKECKV